MMFNRILQLCYMCAIGPLLVGATSFSDARFFPVLMTYGRGMPHVEVGFSDWESQLRAPRTLVVRSDEFVSGEVHLSVDDFTSRPYPESHVWPIGLEIFRDGIYVVGLKQGGPGQYIFVYRLDRSGHIDESFGRCYGTDGHVRLYPHREQWFHGDFPLFLGLHSPIVVGLGRGLMIGASDGAGEFAMRRLNLETGEFDSQFGQAGILRVPLPSTHFRVDAIHEFTSGYFELVGTDYGKKKEHTFARRIFTRLFSEFGADFSFDWREYPLNAQFGYVYDGLEETSSSGVSASRRDENGKVEYASAIPGPFGGFKEFALPTLFSFPKAHAIQFRMVPRGLPVLHGWRSPARLVFQGLRKSTSGETVLFSGSLPLKSKAWSDFRGETARCARQVAAHLLRQWRTLGSDLE